MNGYNYRIADWSTNKNVTKPLESNPDLRGAFDATLDRICDNPFHPKSEHCGKLRATKARNKEVYHCMIRGNWRVDYFIVKEKRLVILYSVHPHNY